MNLTNKMSNNIDKMFLSSSGKISLGYLSGWGVALAVSLVAAPAIWNYWFSAEEGHVPSSKTSQSVTPSAVTFAIPSKPTERTSSSASAGPVVDPAQQVSSTVQPVAFAQPAEPVQSMEDQVQPHDEPSQPIGQVVQPVAVPAQPAVMTKPTVSAQPAELAKSDLGWARIQSEPGGADVIVDGSFLGVTPLNVELVSGAHELIIRKRGYRSVIRPMDVANNRPLNLSLILQSKSDPSSMETVVVAKKKAPETVAKAVMATTQAAQPRRVSASQKQPSKPGATVTKVKEPVSVPEDFKYSIQVGSFSERKGAFRLASELRDKGFDAYVYESWGKKDPSRLWKSVRVGRFQELKNARAALKHYKKIEDNPGAYVALNDAAAKIHEVPGKMHTAADMSRMKAPEKVIKRPVAAVKPVSVEKKKETSKSSMPPIVKSTGVSAKPKTTKAAVSRQKPVAESMPAATEETVASDEVAKEEAEHMFQQSLAFRNNRNLAQEEVLLKQVLQKDPEHGFAQRRLSRILVESGRIAEGLGVLKGAVRGRSSGVLVGEDPNLAAFLAALYQQQGEHKKAIELYKALLQRFPDKGIWRMGLAISMEKVGEFSQALQAYESALASVGLSEKLHDFVQKRIQRLR